MKPTLYDVAVIGGGPAGMMAAGRAAELGAKVILIEKNAKLGKKLLITGGGRCNITNAEFEIRKMVAKYGPKGKALFGSFTRFGVEETLNFFNTRGLPTKVEAEKRAFPVSNKAEDVWKVMVEYVKKGNVEILYSSPVIAIETSSPLSHPDLPSVALAKEKRRHPELKDLPVSDDTTTITGVKLANGKLITAKTYIITTGGKSRPETGSTGEGLEWMKSIGHAVEESDSALVPVKTKDQWTKDLFGTSFTNAKLSIFQDGKKQDSRIGKVLLTHFGLSGPLVINMSKSIAELYKYGPVTLHLDVYPEVDLQTFDKKVLETLNKYLNKKIRNSLGEIIPPKMIGAILEQTKINPEKEVNALTKEERLRITNLLKAIPFTVSGFLGVEKAIVTSGGVSLKEIDFKTMQSKLFSNLYLAGDILNFDRPSGGFSLQICWTTGFLAGEHSIAN